MSKFVFSNGGTSPSDELLGIKDFYNACRDGIDSKIKVDLDRRLKQLGIQGVREFILGDHVISESWGGQDNKRNFLVTAAGQGRCAVLNLLLDCRFDISADHGTYSKALIEAVNQTARDPDNSGLINCVKTLADFIGPENVKKNSKLLANLEVSDDARRILIERGADVNFLCKDENGDKRSILSQLYENQRNDTIDRYDSALLSQERLDEIIAKEFDKWIKGEGNDTVGLLEDKGAKELIIKKKTHEEELQDRDKRIAELEAMVAAQGG